jgi:hypothetical protein
MTYVDSSSNWCSGQDACQPILRSQVQIRVGFINLLNYFTSFFTLKKPYIAQPRIQSSTKLWLVGRERKIYKYYLPRQNIIFKLSVRWPQGSIQSCVCLYLSYNWTDAHIARSSTVESLECKQPSTAGMVYWFSCPDCCVRSKSLKPGLGVF